MTDIRSVGFCAAVVGFVLAAAGPAHADVVDKSPAGFTLKTSVSVAAPAERTFRALVDIGAWWSSDHTYSGDAKNLSIAAQPGGCFCEKLPNGGGVEHGRVVQVQPGTLLRLDAALGPLQSFGVAGSLTWQVEKAAQGSTVTLTYVVGGYAPGGLDALAGPVDAVFVEQIQRLEAYLEQAR